MAMDVRITRTDNGATTAASSPAGHEYSKDYPSWDEALAEAASLRLMDTIESTAARLLPPGFTLHGSAAIDSGSLQGTGFCCTKDPVTKHD